MAVLNGGYLVRLLFISLLDLFKKGTREMTESQKAILNLLKDKDMTLEDMAVELHSCTSKMRKIVNNMEKSKWIEKDEDTDLYTILIDYAPSVEWSFKEILGAWK